MQGKVCQMRIKPSWVGVEWEHRGPEYEEKAKNSDAHSSTCGKELNFELVGGEISNGHVFD